MIHFQPEIDRACRVRQRADRNVINAGSCDSPHVFQRDAAARFELDVVSSQRQSFPNLSWNHVVQKDYVDAIDLDKSPRLLQIVSLHFDADLGTFLAKPANLIGTARTPSGGRKMIVLYEDHIVKARTVITATAGDNRSLFKYAQPGSCFARIEYFGRMISDGVNKLAGERRDAAETLKKI